MPAQFTPPQTRRGRRGWQPDSGVLEGFIEIMNSSPPDGETVSWAIGDETAETRLESYGISGKYRREIERMTGNRVTSRHFAVDEEDNIIKDAPEDGGPGITWRFCCAWA